MSTIRPNSFTPVLNASQTNQFEEHPQTALVLLKNGIDPHQVSAKGSNMFYLHCAVDMPVTPQYPIEDKRAVIDTILDLGVDPNQTVGSEGHTPLHLAAKRGDAQVIQLLLERGAKPELRDAEGRTPLDLAQQEGYDANILKLLTPKTVAKAQ